MNSYDFALNWSGTLKEDFVKFLKAACTAKKLSFLWISDENVRNIVRKLQSHQLAIKMLIDTEATYNKQGDPYARVCYAVKDSGGVVVNDPDRAKVAIDKAVIHYELVNAGIMVPYTVVVRNWEPNNFKLNKNEKRQMGSPFVIKPALGYGQQGVLRNACGTVREIAMARNFDRGDNFLLQEKIIPLNLGRKRAWFRVFNVFDTIIPCWWDDQQNLYEHVGYEEFNNFRLYSLVKIVSKIAAITEMVWFSTEIAIDMKDATRRFLTIDYVNDQCDMGTMSETPSGVPDVVVRYTADSMAAAAYRMMNNEALSRRYRIFLKDATIEIRGLGVSPDLLKQVYNI